ncbi:MAG: ATP-binding protein [Myxococcota bacterium]
MDEERDAPGAVHGDERLVEALRVVAPHLSDILGVDVSLRVLEGSEEPSSDCDHRAVVIGDEGAPLARVETRVAGPSLPHDWVHAAEDAEAAAAELAQMENLDRRLLLHRTSTADTLDAVLDAITARLPYTRVAVVLAERGGSGGLHVAAHRNLPPGAIGVSLDCESGPVGRTIRSGSPRAFPADRFALDASVAPDADTVTVVPLLVPPVDEDSEEPVHSPGAILVINQCSRPLRGSELEYLRRAGVHGAVLLENARLLDSLRSSEETYRTLVERAHLGMALLDRDLGIRHVNRPLRDLLGRGADRGTPLYDLVLPADRDRACAHVAERLEGDGDPVDVDIQGEDGATPVNLLVTPLGEHAETPTGWAAIIRDRRREIALEEERQNLSHRVQQAEKMAAMGKFVAGIAHELNNPLTVVIGYTELLTETARLPKHHQASLHQVLSHARRAGRIVEDLLKFSHHEQARPEPVHLGAVVEEALAAVSSKHRGEIDFRVEVPEDLPAIAGSGHALAQVVTNIVENAIDAVRLAEAPHEIRIRVERGEGEQRIRIADSGPGIPEPERIFDPFYTTKPIGKGTGLGLSICYGIVRDHDGDLFAENMDDAGARMTVVLPERRPEEQVFPALPGVGTEEAPGGAAIRADTRLLVVDDEEAILRLANDSLSRYCQVTTAETVEDAVRLLEHERYDVILTDLRLPDGLTGADFYEIILERWPDMVDRLAFMTGDTVGQATQAFLDRVRRPCLSKPFKLSQLTGFVEALLS